MSVPKILIAEDDPQLRLVLGQFLESKGFQSICVQDGCQAMEYAVRERPDLILLDMHMPAGDGFSVEARLQMLPEVAMTPIIFMSSDESTQEKLEEEGHFAAAFFHKPFVLADLLATIRRVLKLDDAEAA